MAWILDPWRGQVGVLGRRIRHNSEELECFRLAIFRRGSVAEGSPPGSELRIVDCLIGTCLKKLGYLVETDDTLKLSILQFYVRLL